MALPMPRVPGYVQMLKEGARHYSGLEEAVIRSIEACSEFTRTLKSAYGPKGLNKMVINHIEKLFVTNDAATIISQLDVQHPAAKMMVMASQMMEQEVGDGTNFVILFCGALLDQAEELIRMGLKPIEIIEGYELARDKVINEFLPKLVHTEVKDVRNSPDVLKAIRSSVQSKQFGNEDFLSKLIYDACLSVCSGSENGSEAAFNVDNVRVVKIVGSGIGASSVVPGMVFKRSVEGTITRVENVKIAVFTCPFDTAATETKGTVLIKSAEELIGFSKGEESLLEAQIKAIADAGVRVIVSGGKFGDMALHYCNKFGLMAVRLQSKFDVRRICKAIGATALTRIEPPKPEELGQCDHVFVDEIGDTSVVIFRQTEKRSRISTVVLRGATDNILDDLERAVDDGINTFKALTKDGRIVCGAGAAEIELSAKITDYAETLPGMEQYAVQKFAEALQHLPTAIADNAGIRSNELIAKLLAAHQAGQTSAGLDIDSDKPEVIDAAERGIVDLYLSKFWGIKYATSTANTILQVDQIICAKAAGGPKPRQGGGDWDQD